MGRPIGSVNREKPFADPLRMEICAGNDPRHLRAIARKLIEMAEGGDLQAIKEVGDRLDGKCAQTIERGDLPWKWCLTVNCSRSFGEGHAIRQSSQVT